MPNPNDRHDPPPIDREAVLAELAEMRRRIAAGEPPICVEPGRDS